MTFTSMSRHQISNVATSAKASRTKKYQCRDIAMTSPRHQNIDSVIKQYQTTNVVTSQINVETLKKGISIEVLNLQCRDITTAM